MIPWNIPQAGDLKLSDHVDVNSGSKVQGHRQADHLKNAIFFFGTEDLCGSQ